MYVDDPPPTSNQYVKREDQILADLLMALYNPPAGFDPAATIPQEYILHLLESQGCTLAGCAPADNDNEGETTTNANAIESTKHVTNLISLAATKHIAGIVGRTKGRLGEKEVVDVDDLVLEVGEGKGHK
tara:strand:- start:234 stop:623 length:390 start_codon:yes stop_codon:yes gene_type:complete